MTNENELEILVCKPLVTDFKLYLNQKPNKHVAHESFSKWITL